MKCPVCDSERISPVAQLGTAAATAGAGNHLFVRFGRPSGFHLRPKFDLRYARVCQDCGAVIPFLTRADAARLGGVEGVV